MEPVDDVVQANVVDATLEVSAIDVFVPLQMVDVEGVAVATGFGLTVMATLPVAVQPIGAVTVTE